MKLIEVQVRNFRNILNSGEVEIQPDVTCLVGKNESGNGIMHLAKVSVAANFAR